MVCRPRKTRLWQHAISAVALYISLSAGTSTDAASFTSTAVGNWSDPVDSGTSPWLGPSAQVPGPGDSVHIAHRINLTNDVTFGGTGTISTLAGIGLNPTMDLNAHTLTHDAGGTWTINGSGYVLFNGGDDSDSGIVNLGDIHHKHSSIYYLRDDGGNGFLFANLGTYQFGHTNGTATLTMDVGDVVFSNAAGASMIAYNTATVSGTSSNRVLINHGRIVADGSPLTLSTPIEADAAAHFIATNGGTINLSGTHLKMFATNTHLVGDEDSGSTVRIYGSGYAAGAFPALGGVAIGNVVLAGGDFVVNAGSNTLHLDVSAASGGIPTASISPRPATLGWQEHIDLSGTATLVHTPATPLAYIGVGRGLEGDGIFRNKTTLEHRSNSQFYLRHGARFENESDFVFIRGGGILQPHEADTVFNNLPGARIMGRGGLIVNQSVTVVGSGAGILNNYGEIVADDFTMTIAPSVGTFRDFGTSGSSDSKIRAINTGIITFGGTGTKTFDPTTTLTGDTATDSLIQLNGGGYTSNFNGAAAAGNVVLGGGDFLPLPGTNALDLDVSQASGGLPSIGYDRKAGTLGWLQHIDLSGGKTLIHATNTPLTYIGSGRGLEGDGTFLNTIPLEHRSPSQLYLRHGATFDNRSDFIFVRSGAILQPHETNTVFLNATNGRIIANAIPGSTFSVLHGGMGTIHNRGEIIADDVTFTMSSSAGTFIDHGTTSNSASRILARNSGIISFGSTGHKQFADTTMLEADVATGGEIQLSGMYTNNMDGAKAIGHVVISGGDLIIGPGTNSLNLDVSQASGGQAQIVRPGTLGMVNSIRLDNGQTYVHNGTTPLSFIGANNGLYGNSGSPALGGTFINEHPFEHLASTEFWIEYGASFINRSDVILSRSSGKIRLLRGDALFDNQAGGRIIADANGASELYHHLGAGEIFRQAGTVEVRQGTFTIRGVEAPDVNTNDTLKTGTWRVLADGHASKLRLQTEGTSPRSIVTIASNASVLLSAVNGGTATFDELGPLTTLAGSLYLFGDTVHSMSTNGVAVSGTIGGDGVISNDVDLLAGGTVTPGQSAGVLTLVGNHSIGADGSAATYQWEPGDHIDVAGDLEMGLNATANLPTLEILDLGDGGGSNVTHTILTWGGTDPPVGNRPAWNLNTNAIAPGASDTIYWAVAGSGNWDNDGGGVWGEPALNGIGTVLYDTASNRLTVTIDSGFTTGGGPQFDSDVVIEKANGFTVTGPGTDETIASLDLKTGNTLSLQGGTATNPATLTVSNAAILSGAVVVPADAEFAAGELLLRTNASLTIGTGGAVAATDADIRGPIVAAVDGQFTAKDLIVRGPHTFTNGDFKVTRSFTYDSPLVFGTGTELDISAATIDIEENLSVGGAFNHDATLLNIDAHLDLTGATPTGLATAVFMSKSGDALTLDGDFATRVLETGQNTSRIAHVSGDLTVTTTLRLFTHNGLHMTNGTPGVLHTAGAYIDLLTLSALSVDQPYWEFERGLFRGGDLYRGNSNTSGVQNVRVTGSLSLEAYSGVNTDLDMSGMGTPGILIASNATLTVKSGSTLTIDQPELVAEDLILSGGTLVRNAGNDITLTRTLSISSGSSIVMSNGEFLAVGGNITLLGSSNDVLVVSEDSTGNIIQYNIATNLGLRMNGATMTAESYFWFGNSFDNLRYTLTNGTLATPRFILGQSDPAQTTIVTIVQSGVMDIGTLEAISGVNNHSTLVLDGGVLKLNVSSQVGGSLVFDFQSGRFEGSGQMRHPFRIGADMVHAPGDDGPGKMQVSSATTNSWDGGGTYEWQIDDAFAFETAGSGWDLLEHINDATLKIDAASGDRFTIAIRGLDSGTGLPGTPDNFAPTADPTDTQFVIATAPNIVGFSADKFKLDITGFKGWDLAWTISQSGDNILLSVSGGPTPKGWVFLIE